MLVSVALLAGADQIVVADRREERIYVYPRTASGAAEPLTTVEHQWEVGWIQAGNQPQTALETIAVVAGFSIEPRLREIDIASGAVVPGHDVEEDGTYLRVDDRGYSVALDPARGRILAHDPYSAITQMPSDFSSAPSAWVSVRRGSTYVVGLAIGLDPADQTRGEAVVLADVDNLGIAVFDLRAPAGSAPIHTMAGPSLDLEHYPRDVEVDTGLAVDHVHGEILVVQPSSVVVYPLLADGDVAPVRRLTGPNTLLQHPTGLALDLAHDELIVSDAATKDVLTFRRDAAGDVLPLRRLFTSRTYLQDMNDLAFDAATGILLVSNRPGTAIAEFVLNNGEASPPTILHNVPSHSYARGISVDADHLYVLLDSSYYQAGSDEYLDSSLGVLPRRIGDINFASGCGFSSRHFLRVLSDTDKLLYLDEDYPAGSGQRRVTTLSPISELCNGSSLSRRVLFGLQGALDIAVDDDHGELFVLESRGVLTFPLDAEGEAVPRRTLQVPSEASRLLFDPKRKRIDVLTPTGVLSYSRTAQGAAHPLGLLQGPRSGLQEAVAFTLCSISP
jgi:hypothetical protein